MTFSLVIALEGDQPAVSFLEVTRHIVDGVVESRSDPERKYVARIVLSANMLCTCPASVMRDARCVHLKALLEGLDAEELRRLILDAQALPDQEMNP